MKASNCKLVGILLVMLIVVLLGLAGCKGERDITPLPLPPTPEFLRSVSNTVKSLGFNIEVQQVDVERIPHKG
ncbi:MAG: hypothetical protein JXB38_07900 [Anaerolineales bacterium]|nr:hypothetical protein [Anaerolineales bacterium]